MGHMQPCMMLGSQFHSQLRRAEAGFLRANHGMETDYGVGTTLGYHTRHVAVDDGGVLAMGNDGER